MLLKAVIINILEHPMKDLVKILSITLLVCVSTTSSAYEQGDMLLRFGGAHVDADNAGKPDGVYAGNDTQLGINFTYLLNNS